MRSITQICAKKYQLSSEFSLLHSSCSLFSTNGCCDNDNDSDTLPCLKCLEYIDSYERIDTISINNEINTNTNGKHDDFIKDFYRRKKHENIHPSHFFKSGKCAAILENTVKIDEKTFFDDYIIQNRPCIIQGNYNDNHDYDNTR